MKKILLRIAAVVSEIRLAKSAELLGGYFSSPGKIFLHEDALDPNIDREGAQPLVGKEHYAIGHFRADPWQLAKPNPEFLVRQVAPRFKVGLARGDEPRRGQQILRPISQGAFPQLSLTALGQSFGVTFSQFLPASLLT